MNKTKNVFKIVFFLIFICLNSFTYGKDIKVGWFIQDKYQEISNSGMPFGYIYDILQQIKNYTDWSYTFVFDSFNNCISMLEKGEIDILGCLFKTPEREEKFDFPQFSIGIASRYIYTKKESPLTKENHTSIENLRIAVIENSNNISAYENYSSNFPCTFIECGNTSTMNKMLEDDFVDAVLSGSRPDNNEYKILGEFAPQPFYLAMAKGSDINLQQLNYALKSIQYSNPDFLSKLVSKYGVSYLNQVFFTIDEIKIAQENKTINVAFIPEWNLLYNANPKSDEFSGYSKKIYEEISRVSGLKFNYVKCDNLEQVYEKLNNGEVDIISLYYGDNKTANQQNLQLSESIISLPLEIIQNPIKNIETNKVGIIQNQPIINLISGVNDSDIIQFSTIEDGLNALKEGEIKFLVSDNYSSNYYLQNKDYSEFTELVLQGSTIDLRVAISNRLPQEIVSIFDKSIASIPNEIKNSYIIDAATQGQNINRKSFGLLYKVPKYMITLFIVVLLAIIFLFAFLLKRKIKYSKFITKKLFTDNLTGLLSKDGFDHFVSQRLEKNHLDSYCIIAMDIEHFEHYNALYGYSAGDELLKNIGKLFINLCPRDELVARLSSDKFVLFANEDTLSAERRIEQIRIGIQKLNSNYKININFGVYRLSNGKFQSAKMRDYAKSALRTVKDNSMKYIGYYDLDLNNKILQETKIAAEMEKALQDREFIVYFQPKYGCNSEKPVGAEALVRWKKNTGEIISPVDFIPLFEKNGFITKLDIYVFEEACKLLENQIAMGIEPVPISTNFSRVHMYNQNFAKKLAEIAGKHNIPPYLLEIEITESAFISNHKMLVSLIENLHGYGFLVSIDDFGSGFSSLNLIKEIRFDVIKIDQIFFNDNKVSSRTKSIILCIIALAKELGMRTVAEGVETEAQFKFLKENKCDTIQGFYFSKPLEENIFTQLLASSDSADT